MSTGFALRPDPGRVFLHGELDLATCDEVRRALSGVTAGQVVNVDLRAVTFMDSSAVDVLLDLVDAGVTPLLHHATPMVARVLHLVGLAGHVVPDR